VRFQTTMLSALALAAALTGTAPALAADKALAQTTFDGDLGGWTTNRADEIVWSAGGGNPGGRAVYTEVSSDAAYPSRRARAPLGARPAGRK
jgi:hypothetical protein